MERSNDTMRSAALIAQDIAERGGGVQEILGALSKTADEIEHGWTGAGLMGCPAGPLWDDGLEDALIALDDVRELLSDKRTVSMAALKDALGVPDPR